MNDKTGQGQPPSKKAPTNRWVKLGFLVVALGVATLIYLRQRSGKSVKLPEKRTEHTAGS